MQSTKKLNTQFLEPKEKSKKSMIKMCLKKHYFIWFTEKAEYQTFQAENR